MSDLTPKVSSTLAKRIYDVQNPGLVDTYLKLPYFKKTTGTSPPSGIHLKGEVGGRIILNYSDGFGVCAEGGGDNKNELFMIFRGTTTANNGADMLTDARIGIMSNQAGLPVHIGFEHCFSSMLPKIKQFIAAQKGVVKVVHCIGHSLGGAIASLAADYVSKNTSFKTKLYTFGCPRVGTDWFVKSTSTSIGEGNIHRVYHRTDPVTLVPLYPFMHAPYRGNGHYIYSAEPLTSGAAHMMDRYIKSVDGKTWTQLCDEPEHPYTIESAIQSWLQSKSPVDSSSATFWRWIDSALIYVLKKIAMATILSLQAVFIGTFTLADKIAYILKKGIDLAEHISIWVELLIRKMMQALGMGVPASKEEMTRSLIKRVLLRITEKSNREARNAIGKVK